MPFTWRSVNELEQCGAEFTKLKQSRYLDYPSISVKYTISRLNGYHDRIKELYSNTSIDVDTVEEHRECSDALNKTMEIADVYQKIAELALNVTKSDTFTEAYSYVIQIGPLYKMTKVSFTRETLSVIDSNVENNCNWMRNIIYNKFNYESIALGEEFEKLEELTRSTHRLFKAIIPLFNSLNNELGHKIATFTGKGQDYLNQKINKSQLSQEFASTLFLKYRENAADFTHDLEQVIKEYEEELILGMEKLKEIYTKRLGFSLPVINNYNVYQLNLVRNATQINDTTLQNITEGLQNNLEGNLVALITETYKRLEQPFTEMKTNLLDPVDDILEQINDLDELLTEYKMSTKMNTHFFM